MAGQLLLRVFDVEHGACAILMSPTEERIAMIDCGHNTTTGWRPSLYIRYEMGRTTLDYLLVTNADQDHLSDLAGLSVHGVNVGVLYRNPAPGPRELRAIKEEQGECTDDIECFLAMHRDYVGAVAVDFDVGMGGVTCSRFCNTYPHFDDTNNLSMAVFVKYGGFKMLFPGDLEDDGWKALLRNPNFVRELTNTAVLVASHHGRYSGYCDDIFNHFTPKAVVISDKPIAHATQEMVPDYRAVVHPDGVALTNQLRRRHVLTTRRDGDILFTVFPYGGYNITTQNG